VRPPLFVDSEFIYGLVIPKDHLLKQIKETVDFSFLREEVKGLYSETMGRPAIPPEVVGKVTLLQYLYTLSDAQAEEQCRDRLVFKYFLDLPVEGESPFDASSLSKIRTRWGAESFQKYFEGIVAQVDGAGILGRSGAWTVRRR